MTRKPLDLVCESLVIAVLAGIQGPVSASKTNRIRESIRKELAKQVRLGRIFTATSTASLVYDGDVIGHVIVNGEKKS